MTALSLSALHKDPLLFQRFGFLANIESSEETSSGSNRWKYTLQPGYLGGSAASFSFTDRGDTVTGLNVYELSNNASNVQGVNPSTLPSGFSFEPATGYVLCMPSRLAVDDTQLKSVWLFCVALTVDGSCP